MRNLFIILSCIGFMACQQSPEQKMESLNHMVDTLEQSNAVYTSESLQAMDSVFEKKLATIDAAKLNAQQRESYNKLKGRYYAVRLKKSVSGFKQDLQDVKQQIEGFIDALKSDDSTGQ